jgi:PAS domain-containing protein
MPTPYDQMTRDELVTALTALQRAVQAGAPGALPQSLAETERLVHELHVHQIELEMQNRELREAQQALEDSRDRYAQLYDFAPVGYLTLDRAQCIAEINLTGAALLSVERARLLGQPFAHYVAAADRPILR